MDTAERSTGKTRLGGRLWFNILFFGLIGQIAWVVENMYFATFCQDIFANSSRGDLSYIVTTLMVIFSALTATVTTVIAGARCDRLGKRRPFIAWGYIVWGFTIMIFALLPMRAPDGRLFLIGLLLVVFDCIMTVAGSTSNDAAFNAFIADNTDPTNRGLVNTVLSTLPVFAVVIVFIGLGSLYSSASDDNRLFFIVLGCIPTAAGVLALLMIRDAPHLKPIEVNGRRADTLYGFRREQIRFNRMLYVCLIAACVVCVAQQTFFSYLMNFVIRTLGYGDGFVIPVAVIIVGAAVFTGAMGALFDRFGRKHFYLPLTVLAILGTFSFYCLKFLDGTVGTLVLYLGGVVMMGAMLALTGALQAAFQDHIPDGAAGRFQGVRMCFTVLIPMIVGPIISMIIGLDAMGLNGADFVPTYEIFLAAAVVALFALPPMVLVRRDADGAVRKEENK